MLGKNIVKLATFIFFFDFFFQLGKSGGEVEKHLDATSIKDIKVV
jgi:hypothetical protein